MHLDFSSVIRAHQQLEAATAEAVQRAQEIAGAQAIERVQQAPGFKPRTGNLQRRTDFRIVKVNGRILRIRNTAPYAAAIDTGARPHLITARRAQFLRFRGRDGNLVFRRSVHHPGNRPYKFLWNAAWAAYRVEGDYLSREMARIASRF